MRETDYADSLSLGEYGEMLARFFLEKKGYLFIRANYRTKHGEIDLIMAENDELVFVEVKTRTVSSAKLFGRGALKIDTAKIKNIYYAANEFIRTEKKICRDLTPRFDAVEVYVSDENRKKAFFNHIKCAFGV